MLKQILVDELRLLTFRAPSASIAANWKAYLAFGLFFTWLAGVGRYWDNPRAQLWQLSGIGSLAYVFVLSAILWVLLAPLRPANWSYRNVLVFVTLTSPPALLYALPVERFMPPVQAALANAWFLALVATWRVGLLGVFLRRVARLPWLQVVVATLLPLALIVVALAILNLEHVIFDLMAGIREEDKSSNDAAYSIVIGLAYLSFISAPFLAGAYAICVVLATLRARQRASGDGISRSEDHRRLGATGGATLSHDEAESSDSTSDSRAAGGQGTFEKPK